MKLYYLVFVVYIMLIGCACKDESFSNEKKFADYVDKLGLSSLKIEEATLRLSVEKFKCGLVKNITLCRRGVPAGGCVCGENQYISLSMSKENLINIKTNLQLACL
jgi:hypothetical protein